MTESVKLVFQKSSAEVATPGCSLHDVAVRMRSAAWRHQLSPPISSILKPPVAFSSPEARITHSPGATCCRYRANGPNEMGVA